MNGAAKKVAYDPAIHHRQSIRMRGHDYAGPGAYFLTICVRDNRPLFGTIVNGRMALNDAGRVVAQCWRDIPNHFPHATLDEWCIMPDHVHGILHLNGGARTGTACRSLTPAFGRPIAGALGTIIGAFKSAATRGIRAIPRTGMACHAPTWQRGYYDIIIRDERALRNIRRYIRDNPANADVHRFGEPRFFAGNRALLDLPMTAFLASRGGVGGGVDGGGMACHAPARWPTRPQCVVSGFLSPMERAVFDACLADDIPMVQVLARGMPDWHPVRVQRAIDDERLLVMTPFEPTVDRFSATRAAWCNQYALHLARDIVVGRISDGGMLACLLADVPQRKPVVFLNKNTGASMPMEVAT